MNLLKLSVAATAALAPLAAHADPDDDRIVVVASGVAQRADTVGRSVTILDREEIEQRQTVALSDLLATTPGITVARNGGLGTATALSIRGAQSDQTLVLIDGIRVNDPSATGGAYNFASLLAGSVERVEVLRGPNSVIWGSQAIGGVVNVTTLQGAQGLHVRGNAEGGSFGTFDGNAAIAGGNDRITAGLTAGYLATDGISAAANGKEADGYRQFGATGNVEVKLIPGLALDLRGYFADSKVDLDGYAPPTYTFGDTNEYAKTQEIYGYAGLKNEALGGKLHSRLGFTLSDIHRDGYNDDSSIAYRYRGRAERYTYQGDATLAEQLRLVFGAEHEQSRIRYDEGFGSAGRYSVGITSFYGQAIVTPIAPLTLNAGIRHDDHDTFGGHWTWNADLAVRAAANTLLHASYGEGFKAPTLYQLYSAYGFRGLRPETAKSYEAGARQMLAGGKVALGVTWFHRDADNQIDYNFDTSTYYNLNKTRAEGIELEGMLQPVKAFTVRANFTHVLSENRSAGYLGKDLPRRPRDTANVTADYRFPFGLAIGGTVTMVGDSFNDVGNATPIDGYALAGIRAEMAVTKRLSVYGRVDNIGDVRYQQITGYGTYGRAAYGGVRVRFQ
ncbi:TonB-dependent receptor plug domain-containing protein [Sphingomonas sp. TDK1]|uniref:TonB-dependent receptor plug domain-containing protein n=1 Tax=Sphingomonas sp. TDK1 TaxID=453247 RepID=UPI0007D8F8EC|nr:TonB-dependent receptor [Sphingomonas sp. TDK1]OAN58434.1 TonB-dependent receptor [Sphingomonas sp. TDK1]